MWRLGHVFSVMVSLAASAKIGRTTLLVSCRLINTVLKTKSCAALGRCRQNKVVTVNGNISLSPSPPLGSLLFCPRVLKLCRQSKIKKIFMAKINQFRTSANLSCPRVMKVGKITTIPLPLQYNSGTCKSKTLRNLLTIF